MNEISPNAFKEPVKKILKEYKNGNTDPLDGDEVDRITEHIRNKLNLFEGNITENEYLILNNKIK